MQHHFREKFKQLDSFGTFYQINFTQQQQQYKSVFGALITLVIYGMCLAFLFYNLIQWQSGQFLPKIMSVDVVYSKYEFTFPETLFTFSGDPQRSKFTNYPTPDPFNPKELLLQPTIQMNFNGAPKKLLDYEFIVDNQTKLYNFQFKSITFLYDEQNTDENPTNNFFISLGACVNSTLPTGVYCAAQEQIDSFLNQTLNYVLGTIRVKQYNSYKKTSEIIEKTFYLIIERSSSYIGQVWLNIQKTTIDDGFLFPNYNSESYISTVDQTSQQVAHDTMYPLYSKDLYIGLVFQISPIVSEQVVQFPKFNEVLADTGSMVSVIFYISILAKLINQKFQNMDAINQVISFYYPNFKLIRFQCSWFGSYSKVFYRDRLLDSKSFQIYYDKLIQIAKQKLSLSNQLYEISRLQFIIQSLQPRYYIQQSHRIGIQLQDHTVHQKIQVLPIINQDIQSNEDREEKIASDEIIHLKNNVSQVQPLQLQSSKRQYEKGDFSLIDDDFNLLINQEENQDNNINYSVNIEQFYKQNLID